MRILAVVVVFFFLATAARESVPPVSLLLYNHLYVKLLVGNPGTYLRMRVNFTENRIHLHRRLDDASNTLFRSSDSENGSEVFYFSSKCRIRFPVSFSVLDGDSAFSLIQEPHDGVVGFGPMSPIWQYWDSATFSPMQIDLGRIRLSSQLDQHECAPIVQYNKFYGGTGNVAIHSNSTFTLAPSSNMESDSFLVISSAAEGSCERMFGGSACLPYKRYQLKKGIGIRTLHGFQIENVGVCGGSTVFLGTEFFRHNVLHVNRRERLIAIAESAFSFKKYGYSSALAVSIAVYILALIMVEMASKNDHLYRAAFFVAEAYGYLMMIVAFVCNAVGLKSGRFIVDFTDGTDPLFAYVVIAAQIACGVWILVYCFLFDKQSRLRYLNRYSFLSSGLLSLWLCAMDNHQSASDLSYVLLLSTVLCIAGAFTSLDAWCRRFKWAWVAWLMLAIHTVFLVVFNVVPALSDTLSTPLSLVFSAALYLAVLVFVPAWIILFEAFFASQASVIGAKK